MTAPSAAGARAAALDRIDRAERQFKLAILGTALVEAVLLGAFLLAADFHNRLHVLLLLSAALVYCTLGAGIVALGAYINRCTQRILAALYEERPEA